VTAVAGAGRLGAAVSYLSAALVAVLMAGCFDPRYVEGAACSERQTCPPGQTCDGMFCRVGSGPASDAADVDAPVIDAAVIDGDVADASDDDVTLDASVDATADALVDATVDALVDATVDALPVAACNARQAITSASTTFSGYSATRVNDGSRDTTTGGDHSWCNEDRTLPAWVQLTQPQPCTVSTLHLYTSADYRIGSYQVQVWDLGASTWRTVADVVGNTEVLRIHGFPTATVTDVRIVARSGPGDQPQYARVNELELY
jgi:hypothetical protein